MRTSPSAPRPDSCTGAPVVVSVCAVASTSTGVPSVTRSYPVTYSDRAFVGTVAPAVGTVAGCIGAQLHASARRGAAATAISVHVAAKAIHLMDTRYAVARRAGWGFARTSTVTVAARGRP